jgi:two-component system sensor kinase FixL
MPDSTELELRLREVEARYEGLLKAAVEAIIIIDAHGVIEDFSKGAERIFGHSEEEVIGQNVKILMPPSHAPHHDRYIGNFHRTHEPKIIGIGREVEGLHKSGRIFPLDLSVGEIQTPVGTKFVGIARDISRRKLAEAELAEQQEEMRFIIEHAPVGIFSADLDGQLISVNPALLRLLKTAPGQLEGRHVAAMFDPAWSERIQSTLSQVLESGQQGQILVLALACADGSMAEVNVYLDRVTRTGKADQFIGQIIDRTAELSAQAAVRRMQAEITHVARLSTLGEMASAIAHEINQPLTAIANQAQAYRRLLQNGKTTLEEIAGGLGVVAEQALQIGQVVKRVRAFVTKRESNREPVNVNSLLTQVIELADLDARRAQVLFEVHLTNSLPELQADSVQIQQVVLNLLRNAIDACQSLESARRRVVVRSLLAGESLIVSVADRGPGVPVGHQDQLFLPFFTTKAEGVGLGLSLSHSIIQAHGGTLVYRDNPEGGAIFEVRLPCGEALPAVERMPA